MDKQDFINLLDIAIKHAEDAKNRAITVYQEALEEGTINTLRLLKDVVSNPKLYKTSV